ncbi:biotin carboxylase N-terminal domain-containing protein [Azohydromonas sediminis]|uniref:ATP-binding protein n=1 Tax=Azohydromonas sediminis TaxID=2259674 RepID=UPI00235087CF|nr:biotin carboxylase N-terminal domain-containing protein [Azohydromonas sediminis]
MFSKILIANRGEIACRVIRTAHRLGYRTVAVYSDADRDAPHVRQADEALRIGPPPAAQSYLSVEALLDAARRSGADAVHPGYGFLSERADFARACTAAGLVFIGPPAEAIEAMGDKAGAKKRMLGAGVPCAPGYLGDDQSDARLAAEAQRLGTPLLVKAVAGGGGRGMRLVRDLAELPAALDGARREAASAFGDGRLMLERLIDDARHIEIQVFADAHGHAVHLGERDCTVQRRRQKVIEEAPSPVVDAARRDAMGRDAVAAARAVGYVGAGTVEFVVDRDGRHYFLEMNTRLQVEHPVTEAVTGFDLVEWQLRVAAGEPLPVTQGEVRLSGHAVEMRLYAEDPYAGFAPQTGRIVHWRPHGDANGGARGGVGAVEGARGGVGTMEGARGGVGTMEGARGGVGTMEGARGGVGTMEGARGGVGTMEGARGGVGTMEGARGGVGTMEGARGGVETMEGARGGVETMEGARGGVRVDDGIAEGGEVTPYYDAMVAKLIAHGRDRTDALRRLHAALEHTPLLGVATNAGLLADLLRHPDVVGARMTTTRLDEWAQAGAPILQRPLPDDDAWALAAAVLARRDGPAHRSAGVAAYDLVLSHAGERRTLRVHLHGDGVEVRAGEHAVRFDAIELCDHTLRYAVHGHWRRATAVVDGARLHLALGARAFVFDEPSPLPAADAGSDPRRARAPVAGVVAHVAVQRGERVRAGQPLVCVEAMKMEMWQHAGTDGVVAAVHVAVRDAVSAGALLVELDTEG